MKKIFTSFLAVALCASVNAQSMKLLTFGLGTPGIDEPDMEGLSISPNGQYVCGSILYGEGYFVADIVNNIYKYEITDDSEGAELRHINNNGLAIGYSGPGITYSIEGVETVLQVPSDTYKYVLGEALSNDGSIMVGSLVFKGGGTKAAYCKDNGVWTPLPEGTEEQLGEYADEGSMAKYVSGDGKVILGCVGDFGPAVIWKMNDKGEYEFDPIFTRIEANNDDDANGVILMNVTAIALSNNGKYAACWAYLIGDEERRAVPVIYNTETGEFTAYTEQQEFDVYGMGISPTAIADNGTFVGIVGTYFMYYCAGSFIWKAGATEAESFSEAFPCFGESFAIADAIGYAIPTGITADGQYIVGYGLYSEDLYDEDADAYFAAHFLYVLFTQFSLLIYWLL